MSAPASTITAAAEWLVKAPRDQVSSAIVPGLRRNFGLSLTEAIAAIREAKTIREASYRHAS